MTDRESKPEFDGRPDGPPRSPTKRCPDCFDDSSIRERPSESEHIDDHHRRIDYWCPECGAHVGTKIDYDGPTPVRTHNGWELH